MQRTQIYLQKTQIIKLNKMAQVRRTTTSDIIRGIINKELDRKHLLKPKKHISLLQIADRIGKLGKKAPHDLATNLDKYLYGGI